MNNIKKIIVAYTNGQTDEWEGTGFVTRTATTQTIESWPVSEPDREKPKETVVAVRTVTAQITLP